MNSVLTKEIGGPRTWSMSVPHWPCHIQCFKAHCYRCVLQEVGGLGHIIEGHEEQGCCPLSTIIGLVLLGAYVPKVPGHKGGPPSCWEGF